MEKFTHLTPTLNVTEHIINITDLDYAKLSEQLQPTREVLAINSNYTHKTLHGYEYLITKSIRKKRQPAKTKRGGCRAGDRTVFNACIEFTVIAEPIGAEHESENTMILRYFPKTGKIQSFNLINPIDTLIRYLRESNIPEFETIALTGEPTPILKNYKFEITLIPNHYINLYNLKSTLESHSYDDILPYPIEYIKHDDGDKRRKIAIVFKNKIRINIWPKSGKVNFLGTKSESSATSIYDFLQHIFTESMDTLICPGPVPDN